MTPLLSPAVSEHLPVIVAVFVLGGLLGSFAVGLIRAVRWNDDRVKRLAGDVFAMAFSSEAFRSAVKEIAVSLTAELKEAVSDLKRRDEERVQAVGRAHQRVDDLKDSTNREIVEIYKRLPPGVSQ